MRLPSPMTEAANRAQLGIGLSFIEKAKRKAIGLGGHLFFAYERLRYRTQWPWGSKLGAVDHITFPCDDLRLAEEFYVGVLGARVVMRITRSMLLRLGWSDAMIDHERAAHLSVTLAGGPRLDLFDYPQGRQRADCTHPHIALRVRPGSFLKWRRRLAAHGVTVSEPRRAGPPGQASFYFNDPFGNRLELVTIGFVDQELEVGMPDRSRLAYDWRDRGNTSPVPREQVSELREGGRPRGITR
jgi:catechol 2,3-dioxygenase-like lactoylglutathione lyase family enzyme